MKSFDVFFDLPTLSWQSWKSVFYFNAEQKNMSAGTTMTTGKAVLSTVVLTQDFTRTQFLL